MITHQRQLPCRPPRRSEGPVTSRLAPRVPLAMPNDDDDMSAIADMSSAHAVERAMHSFCMRDWSSMRALYCVRGAGRNLRAHVDAVPVGGVHRAARLLVR